MAAKKCVDESADWGAIRQRFATWRRTKAKGERIPEALWRSAVQLVASSSLSQVASALKLDYYSLKKRVEGQAAGDNSDDEADGPFVALPATVSATVAELGECVLELEDGGGSRLRMHLKGYRASELATLGRSLWRG